MKKNILLFTLTLLIISCSSSKPSNFYNVTAMKNFDVKINNNMEITIKTVNIPNYLSKQQIVTTNNNVQFNISEINRWLEPLQYSIQRIIAENLGLYMQNSTVKTISFEKDTNNYIIHINIDRLDGSFDGWALLNVTYNITKGNNIVFTRQIELKKEFTSNKNDYGQLVLIYSELLDELSVDIAKNIVKL